MHGLQGGKNDRRAPSGRQKMSEIMIGFRKGPLVIYTLLWEKKCLMHSPAFKSIKMSWVAGLAVPHRGVEAGGVVVQPELDAVHLGLEVRLRHAQALLLEVRVRFHLCRHRPRALLVLHLWAETAEAPRL